MTETVKTPTKPEAKPEAKAPTIIRVRPVFDDIVHPILKDRLRMGEEKKVEKDAWVIMQLEAGKLVEVD